MLLKSVFRWGNRLSVTLPLSFVFLSLGGLGGCATAPQSTEPAESAKNSKATEANVATKKSADQTAKDLVTIEDVSFVLPKTSKWAQRKNLRKNGRIVAEWGLANAAEASPITIAYQRFAQRQSPKALLETLVKPYRQHCKDSKISLLNLPSRYPDKLGAEILCSQFAEKNYGLIIEVALYSDTIANHLVLGEVRTPPTKVAGQFSFNNDKEQLQVERNRLRFEQINGVILNAKVCDIDGHCY